MQKDISIKEIKKQAEERINQLFDNKVEYAFSITRKLLLSVHIRSKDGRTINQAALDTFNCWLNSINAERQARMFEKVQHFIFDIFANAAVDILSTIIDWI